MKTCFGNNFENALNINTVRYDEELYNIDKNTNQLCSDGFYTESHGRAILTPFLEIGKWLFDDNKLKFEYGGVGGLYKPLKDMCDFDYDAYPKYTFYLPYTDTNIPKLFYNPKKQSEYTSLGYHNCDLFLTEKLSISWDNEGHPTVKKYTDDK